MNYFTEFITNKFIYVPLLTWFGIQLFKVIWDLVTTKKFNFKRILGAGGMPSSHSAVVVSLATLIGREHGLDSSIFALSVIFAFVVMYDAAGVRRAAGKQAATLNNLLDRLDIQVDERLKELLGHSPVEVTAGAILGIVIAVITNIAF